MMRSHRLRATAVSLPGLTRQTIFLRKMRYAKGMDPRVKPAGDGCWVARAPSLSRPESALEPDHPLVHEVATEQERAERDDDHRRGCLDATHRQGSVARTPA